MVRSVLLGCGVVSSVLYVTTDVLGALLYPGYRYTEQQFSELTAAGSPVRPFMIAVSVVPYTLLVVALAVGGPGAQGGLPRPCWSGTGSPAW